MLALLFIREGLLESGVPQGAILAILIALGVVIYLPLLAWRSPEVIRDVRSLVPGRFGGKRAARPEPGGAALAES